MASRFAALSLPVALALLSACQLTPGSTPPFQTPTFRIQAAGGDVTAPVRSAGTPAEGTDPTRVAPLPDGEVAPADGGQLTVQFGHLLGKAERRLLATVADVDKVTITLSGNGVNRTETVLKAAIVGGTTSVTFTGLPAGALTVTIQALDAGGVVIGQDVQQATVTAGQTTVMASTVLLAPPPAPPRTIVAGGSGGSGGSGGGSTTGGLTTTVTLVNGASVISPTIAAGFLTPGGGKAINGLGLGQDGRLWFQEDIGPIRSFDRAGTFGAELPRFVLAGREMVQHFDTSDPGGRILYNFIDEFSWAGGIAVVAANGASVKSGFTSLSNGFSAVAADPQGRLWCLDVSGLRRLADPLLVDPQSGLFAFTESHPVAGTGEKLAIDGAGNVWITATRRAGPSSWEIGILKYDTSFNLAFEAWQPATGVYYRDLALDSQDNVWIAYNGDRQTVEKRAPSGAILKTTWSAAPLNHLFIDANDHVWAFNRTHYPHLIASNTGGAGELVMRLGPDGGLLGYYALGEGADVTGLVVTSDQLWVGTETKGLLRYTIPPLPSPGP